MAIEFIRHASNLHGALTVRCDTRDEVEKVDSASRGLSVIRRSMSVEAGKYCIFFIYEDVFTTSNISLQLDNFCDHLANKLGAAPVEEKRPELSPWNMHTITFTTGA